MKRVAVLALTSVLASGCYLSPLVGYFVNTDGKALYKDRQTGFTVRFGQSVTRGEGEAGTEIQQAMGAGEERGEKGEINPAVVEYILGAPEGPLARYYAAAIDMPSPPTAIRRDLARLRGPAGELASESGHPGGAAYARALARLIAAPVNNATVRAGAANIWWGLEIDLDSGLVKREFERRAAYIQTTLYRYQTSGMVVVYSTVDLRIYAWDLSEVPGAFDASAQLAFDDVAQNARALHPTHPREARR